MRALKTQIVAHLNLVPHWSINVRPPSLPSFLRSTVADGVPVVAQRNPTVPSSPQVLRRGSGKVAETSEQRELREMAEAQAALKVNLRQVRRKSRRGDRGGLRGQVPG